jgi:hypothetical protein
VKHIRHIPDAARLGYTYCGRVWSAGAARASPIVDRARLPVIDLARDCIDDAECKACQRSDDRRTRETHRREQLAAAEACGCIDCMTAGEPTH